jgi:hypothetical protein
MALGDWSKVKINESSLYFMANWQNLGERGNVEDRRGAGPVMIGGGLGVGGLVLLLALNLLGGGDGTEVLTELVNSQVQTQQSYDAQDFAGADEYEVFASTVLGSTDEMWSKVFADNGKTYASPTLVLFRGATDSACGGATSDMGPHYCPFDQTIYLDETFFEELTTRFAAKGGDVAEAYVIAHEAGHHAQNLLGTLDEGASNEASIATELQADCYAGLWAYSIRDLGVFEPGEISEALDAAAAVGDDHVQETVTGRVNPESWTHGSSAERVAAFTAGFSSGSLRACQR